MAAIYDALGNYMGDDGRPEVGALATPIPSPVSTAPIAGTAPPPSPLAIKSYPPNTMGGKGPMVDVPYNDSVGLGALEQYATDTMPMGALDEGAMPPEGALMQPQAEDTGIFSFLNKPGASDSLVAFGSAMLRGNTFNEGLANAADAVTKVAQQYRAPTPREIALAQMKGKLARAASGNTDSQGNEWDLKNPVVGKDGRMYYPGTDASGNIVFKADTGDVVSSVPGMMSPTYSEIANRNRATGAGRGKDMIAVEADVQQAQSKINSYQMLRDTIDTAGVGSDVYSQVAGRVAELAGVDLLGKGIDLSDRQVAKQQIADLRVSAAQALKGQGQVTEFERKMLADTLINLDNNPDGAKRVLDILEKAEQRKIDQYIKYQQLIEGGSTMSWTMFQIKYGQDLEASQGNRSDGSSKPKTGNSSIFDEADAIVGN